MDDRQLIAWQDVLDEIAAGRPNDLTCPFCNHKPLAVTDSTAGRKKISCPECKQFIEGSFQQF